MSSENRRQQAQHHRQTVQTDVAGQLGLLRQSGESWKSSPYRVRSECSHRFAELIARRFEQLCQSVQIPERNDNRETITAELLPLAAAARYLGKRSRQILSPRHPAKRLKPFWIGNVDSVVQRHPWGVVMIIGTWNYPIFLTGVQMLQALVAGNTIVVKPAQGCEVVTQLIADILIDAGFPPDAILVTQSDTETASSIIRAGVDHVVMTGSSSTGRVITESLSNSLTSATLELSGCDSLFVLPGADLERAVAAVRFGCTLNSGATCMAPRRVIVVGDTWEVFNRLLDEMLDSIKDLNFAIRKSTIPRLRDLVDSAIAEGARFATNQMQTAYDALRIDASFTGEASDAALQVPLLILKDVTHHMAIAQADIFAPIGLLMRARRTSQAIEMDHHCPYALTSSIFGASSMCETVAKEVFAGCIVFNDIIAPTADPRVPFGGWNESGYGVTRGQEGLLAMTRPRTVIRRKGNWLPHLDVSQPTDQDLLAGLLQFTYLKSWREKWEAIKMIVESVRNRKK